MPEPLTRADKRKRRVLHQLVEQIILESGSDASADFRTDVWLEQFLIRPLRSLGGHLPADVLRTRNGLSLVADIIARMQSGAFS